MPVENIVSMILSSLIVFVFAVIITGMTYKRKSKISCMTGMMIAMTLGMMVGLTLGIIFGMTFSGKLFQSTILSMTAGMIAGILPGAAVSIMALLDGMLSGLMAGMMGAMLGEMVDPSFSGILLKIMLVLFVGISFILLYMIKQELTPPKGKDYSWMERPHFVILFMLIFFSMFNWLISPGTLSFAGIKTGPQLEIKEINIITEEFAIQPDAIHIQSHRPIKLVISNNGHLDHNLKIIGLQADIKKKPDHSHEVTYENDRSIHLHTSPGGKEYLTFVPLEPGFYQMICTIPGHKEAGMEGYIKVS